MIIFNSYVKLPEGNRKNEWKWWLSIGIGGNYPILSDKAEKKCDLTMKTSRKTRDWLGMWAKYQEFISESKDSPR